jgi:DNA-binding CsgD family transcriptional regulator
VSALTTRQREVMQLVCEGLTAQAIGEQLGISSRTVEIHRRAAVAKLGARNQTHAAVLFDRTEAAERIEALIDGAGELEGFVCYFDDMVKVSEMAKWRGWAGQEPKPEWTPYDQTAATIAALRAEVERKDAAIGNAIGAICFTYDDPDSAVVTELHAALSARGLDIREIEALTTQLAEAIAKGNG